MPGWNTLSTISRCENVSLDWLTDGDGSPFNVVDCDDIEHAQIIRYSADEEPCDALYVVTTYGNFCVVTTTQTQLQLPKKPPVDYTEIGISGKGVGPLTMAAVAYTIGRVPVRLVDVQEDVFERLVTGYMGNPELIGWKNTEGILSDATGIASKKDFDELMLARGLMNSESGESEYAYGAREDRASYNSEELNLIHAFRQMPENKRKALIELLT